MTTIRERAAEWNDDPNPLHTDPGGGAHRATDSCTAEAVDDRRALLDALDALVEAVDHHGVCTCQYWPGYPRGDRHAPDCDGDPGLRAAIAKTREVAG